MFLYLLIAALNSYTAIACNAVYSVYILCMLCGWLAGTRYIKMFILDEADEMLSRGFKDQIYDVFRTLNENIQVGDNLPMVDTGREAKALFNFGCIRVI